MMHRAGRIPYSSDIDPVTQRVEQHAPLVRKLAFQLLAKLPASVEVDDLIQVGLMGLMEAAQNFDATQGAQFETYASQRIRGAMLDELRHADWLPRHVRRQMKQVEASMARLEQTLGRHPSEAEVAQAMGLDLEEYRSTLDDARGHQLLYYDDWAEDDSNDELDRIAHDSQSNPSQLLEDAAFRQQLIHGISHLPEREQLLMSLYYDEELNLKEIGAVLGVTESRVSQLHSQAVARLRSHLNDWVHAPERRTSKKSKTT